MSFTCPDCNRRFANLYSLRRHAVTHDTTTKTGKALKLECHICGASYSRNLVQMYYEHLLKEHNIETNFVKPDKKSKKSKKGPAIFKCKKCPTAYATWACLRKHLKEKHAFVAAADEAEEVTMADLVESSSDEDYSDASSGKSLVIDIKNNVVNEEIVHDWM
jgi:DNA-directed RNA polymerase subunit M/transcription elongation factor TFIIS